MKKAFEWIIIIVGILILIVVYLYAREGRLSLDNLKSDYDEAVSLKQAEIDEKIHYVPVSYTDFIAKLKDAGLVVGDVTEFSSNNFGAKVAVKFTVDGKSICFYNLDLKTDLGQETKTKIENGEKLFFEGKSYTALMNDDAVIIRWEENNKSKQIKDVFEKMLALSYDQMIEERNSKSGEEKKNPIDDILDNCEAVFK